MNTNPVFADLEIVDDVEIVDDAKFVQPPQSSAKPMSVFERMLSPQSLQVMMMSGGGVLAIGFAIWLWSIGLFDNPIIAAVSMGAANLGLLASGVLLLTRTRFQLAGRGLAFLSCLLLPLHLWFYNAQGLIVVANGGHLWIPALLFCGIFALVARLTRDSIFVYTLVGGIVLAGLLFLASPHVAFLWSVIPTCAFLVTVGTIAIHADRLFVEKEGAFSRQQFGWAFFRAGHIVLAGGLAYLLFSQTMSVLLSGLSLSSEFFIGENHAINFWSLPILATAGWACIFSHIGRPRGQVHLMSTAAIAIWMGLTALNVFSVELTVNLLFLLVAIGMVGIQFVFGLLKQKVSEQGSSVPAGHDSALISVANMGLATVGLGQGVAALLLPELFLNLTFLIQALVTVVSLWASTEIGLGESNKVMSNVRLSSGSLLLVTTIVVGMVHWLSCGLSLAIGIVLAGLVLVAVVSQVLSSPRTKLATLLMMGSATVGLLIVTLLLMVAGDVAFVSPIGLTTIAACGSLLAMAAAVAGSRSAGVASFFSFTIFAAQTAVFFDVTSAMPIIMTISMLGVLTSVVAKLSAGLNKKDTASASFALSVGSVLIVGGAGAAILYVLPLLCLSEAAGIHAGFLLFQLLSLAVGFVFAQVSAWRQSFQSLAIAILVLSGITFASASTIPFIYRTEIAALVAGAVLLTVGHWGWAKEEREVSRNEMSGFDNQVRRSDAVSLSLSFGGMFVAIPMTAGIIAIRLFGVEAADFWRVFHEVGALALGLGLLGSGLLCRIRSTTLSGSAVLVSYVGTLLLLIRLPAELQSISVLMMVGGGLFFGTAILLSVYRDWLLGLPSKIKEGTGVFKVLKWR